MTERDIEKYLRDFSDNLLFICDELEKLSKHYHDVKIDYAIDDIHSAVQYLDEVKGAM